MLVTAQIASARRQCGPAVVNAPKAASWAIGKRVLHWALALAVLVALIAPKPEGGRGLVHVSAGVSALALVFMRIGWRLFGDVRPYVKDAWRFKAPDLSKGLRGAAPLLMQGARLGGFAFLAFIPFAVLIALVGIGQGEDSLVLEAHEAAGKVIMVLAIAHAAAVIAFSALMKFDVVGVTLSGAARSVFEGGARGGLGLIVGGAIGISALVYVWGPFDLASKVSALNDHETGAGREEDDD
ncbi:MAG TPA: hypothetical protein DDZ68_06655 [Parvularcula sp.]|nr:hypothetical protein [Parvularcula sp.]HBS30481.1 hypothetical protein [Parvularcula sp.]